MSLLIGPLWIAPLFDNFRRLSDRALEAQILTLADRAGLEAERVFEVEKSNETTKLNAYLTGGGGTKRIVLWDTLTAKLDDDEVLFVMAHELGHYVVGHVRRQVLVTWLVGIAALAFAHVVSMFLLRHFRRRFGFAELADFASLPLLMLAVTGFSVLIGPALLAHSRHQETEADRFALELTRDNEAGVTALAKLQTENLAVPEPGVWYRLFRASHPPIGGRIRFVAQYRPWEAGAPLRYDHLFDRPE